MELHVGGQTGSKRSTHRASHRDRWRQSRMRGRGSTRERCGGRGVGRTSVEGGGEQEGEHGKCEERRGGAGLRRGGRVRVRGRGRYQQSSSAHSPTSSAGS